MNHIALSPESYLGTDDVICSTAPAVTRVAAELRAGRASEVEFARAAFEWVRDGVRHSWDAQDPRMTVTATEVLQEGVGLCFAKSHLLTALLRNQQIPSGLCYQRLHDGEAFVIHGLVALYVGVEWHRLDPRGNKPGVDAGFSLDEERLAWTVDPRIGEVDYRTVHASAAPEVLAAMYSATDALELCRSGLPDRIAE